MVDLTKATDEEAAPLVEKRLGVTMENTGGNVMCFVFTRADGAVLYFGWCDGPLGFSLCPEDSDQTEHGELAADADADAQADFIMATCARLGFKIK